MMKVNKDEKKKILSEGLRCNVPQQDGRLCTACPSWKVENIFVCGRHKTVVVPSMAKMVPENIAFTKRKYYGGNGNQCAICLDSCVDNDYYITECEHVFHRTCLSKLQTGFCPTCRGAINLKKVELQKVIHNHFLYNKLLAKREQQGWKMSFSELKSKGYSWSHYSTTGELITNAEYSELEKKIKNFINTHSVNELRDMCSKNGRKITGTKTILAKRIIFQNFIY